MTDTEDQEIEARERGRDASHPTGIPAEGWKDVLWRVWNQFNTDRVMLVAAGATFYLLLALFPALAVFVSIYGLISDPAAVAEQLSLLEGVLPTDGIDFMRTQLDSLTAQTGATLSVGFVSGFLFMLWTANNGVKTLFEAMNVAYDENEKRSFIRLNLITFLFTLCGMAVGIVFIVGVGVVPALLALVGLSDLAEATISLLRWPILFLAAAFAISALYRFGPSRESAKWRWVTWGGVLATAAWLASSILFSWYLTNFANYNATYGSLGAVIGFMMWTWVSVVVVILGAELNAEMEHQTARDSTTGPAKPMGDRGATVADTLGRSRNEPPAPRLGGPGEARRSDDLTQISGIGPAIEKRLNRIGIVRFEQIADWKKDDMDGVDGELGFRGKVDLEDWVRQARALAETERGA